MIYLLSLLILLLTYPNIALGYTILGGLDEAKASSEPKDEVTEILRHFSPPRQVKLRTQSHESSGRVSMAGTLWEASPLLADYITNPACPLEAFQRMSISEDDVQPQTSEPSTVVELGSGIGLASLAAAFLGCRVHATDGSPSSIRLLNDNFDRYTNDCPIAPHASMLEWGDANAADALIRNHLQKLPDIVMASDVVYAHSAREELSQTVRQLCPRGHINGRVLIAHRWRADPVDEQAFFQSFDDEFDMEEVGIEYFPNDEYYRTRSFIDMKYPISIFEMRRKW